MCIACFYREINTNVQGHPTIAVCPDLMQDITCHNSRIDILSANIPQLWNIPNPNLEFVEGALKNKMSYS